MSASINHKWWLAKRWLTHRTAKCELQDMGNLCFWSWRYGNWFTSACHCQIMGWQVTYECQLVRPIETMKLNLSSSPLPIVSWARISLQLHSPSCCYTGPPVGLSTSPRNFRLVAQSRYQKILLEKEVIGTTGKKKRRSNS